MKRFIVITALCLSICIPFTGCGNKEDEWTDESLGSIAEEVIPDGTIVVDESNFIEIVDDIYENFDSYEGSPIQITAQTMSKNDKQVVYSPCSTEQSSHAEGEILYLQYKYDDPHSNQYIGEWCEIFGTLKKEASGGGKNIYYIEVQTIAEAYHEDTTETEDEPSNETSEESSENTSNESSNSTNEENTTEPIVEEPTQQPLESQVPTEEPESPQQNFLQKPEGAELAN